MSVDMPWTSRKRGLQNSRRSLRSNTQAACGVLSIASRSLWLVARVRHQARRAMIATAAIAVDDQLCPPVRDQRKSNIDFSHHLGACPGGWESRRQRTSLKRESHYSVGRFPLG